MTGRSWDGYMSLEFQVEILESTVAILDERIDQAISVLLHPDFGYGLTADAVVNLLNVLRGESDASLEGQLP